MLLKSLIKEECTFNNVRITQPLQRRVPAVPTKREYEALMHLFRKKPIIINNYEGPLIPCRMHRNLFRDSSLDFAHDLMI